MAINVKIDAAELDNFCEKLIKRSRNINKTHDALVTLESFISLYAEQSKADDEYIQIESLLKRITDHSRQLLLQKNTEDLVRALQSCDINRLTEIHCPLSRNGFYQILQVAISDLSDDEIRLAMVWSSNWVKEARMLAQKASGYPDSFDFKQAGIDIEEYHAVCDIDRVLNPQT